MLVFCSATNFVNALNGKLRTVCYHSSAQQPMVPEDPHACLQGVYGRAQRLVASSQEWMCQTW